MSLNVYLHWKGEFHNRHIRIQHQKTGVVVKWISSTYLPESSRQQINKKPDIVISMFRKVLKCEQIDEEWHRWCLFSPAITTRII